MTQQAERHAQETKIDILILKAMTIAALLALPFSFSQGLADWKYLGLAPIIGGLWITALASSWRTGAMRYKMLGILVFFGGFQLSKNLCSTEPPLGHFLQWLSLSMIVVFLLLTFRFEKKSCSSC